MSTIKHRPILIIYVVLMLKIDNNNNHEFQYSAMTK